MIPKNELGVIVLFAQECEEKGWSILEIDQSFPDAIIMEQSSGIAHQAEFEFCASNFRTHKHDLRNCDVIICWSNDWADCPITVWSLENWSDPHVVSVPLVEKENAQLNIDNGRLMSRIATLEASLAAAQKAISGVDEPEPYQCGDCPRVFATQQALNAHSRVHKGDNGKLPALTALVPA